MIKQMDHILVAGLMISLTMLGCKGDTGPVGPSAVQSGDIYGRMYLFDEDSSNIVDRSGVAISVSGTNKSALTERNGWWRINGLSAGTYTIVFSKLGYGTYKQFGFQFVGGDSLFYGFWALGNVAKYHVTSFSASVGNDSVHFSGTVSSAGRPNSSRYVVVFVDTVATVSSTHYSGTLFTYISSNTTFFLNIAASEFVNYFGIQRGSNLYCVSHGLDDTFGQSYYDPTIRATIFPTTSPTPSQVINVQLP